MDTVDNGREPLGEEPAASGFQIFGTAHLGGGVVEKIIVAADEMAAQRQALVEIRELHGKMPIYPLAEQKCHDDEHAVIEASDGDWVCTCAPPNRHVCETCRDVDGDYIDYPCPTMAAMQRAGLA